MDKTVFLQAVRNTLVEHPEWLLDTLEACTRAVHEKSEYNSKRVADMSAGLSVALGTKPGAKNRQSDLIIKAIEVSSFAGTPWAEEAIKKEQK